MGNLSMSPARSAGWELMARAARLRRRAGDGSYFGQAHDRPVFTVRRDRDAVLSEAGRKRWGRRNIPCRRPTGGGHADRHHWLVAFATARNRKLESVIEGDPVTMIRNGRPARRGIKRNNILDGTWPKRCVERDRRHHEVKWAVSSPTATSRFSSARSQTRTSS